MATYSGDNASSIFSLFPDKPFEQTALTEKLGTSDPLIALAGSKSSAASKFQGTKPAVAQIIGDDGVLYPALGSSSMSDLRFYFRIYGNPVATRFCIDVVPHGSRRRAGHIMKMEFFPSLSQVQFLKVDVIDVPLGDKDNKHGSLEIEWKTNGGISTGLDYHSTDIDRDSEYNLKRIRQLGKNCSGERAGGRRIKMRVKNVEGLLSELRSLLTSQPQQLWYPYRWTASNGNQTAPRCQVDSLQSRKIVQQLSGGALIRYPVQNSFVNATEAFIIMANGMWIEYRKAPCHIRRDSWVKNGGTSAIWFRQQLEGLKCLFSPSCHGIWVRTFLNQKIKGLSMNELPCLPLSHSNSQISSAMNWSTDQVDALMIGRKFLLRGNVKIIEGAPGTGKSTVLAGIAASFALVGTAVLVVTPSSISGPVLMNKIDALLKNSKPDASLKSNVNIVHISDEIDYSRFCKSSLGNTARIDILVTTPNVVCSETIMAKFGMNHDKIIVLYDDAHVLMEPEIIATIFCLKNVEKVCGLVMTTDTYEWSPSVVTEVTERPLCTQKDHEHVAKIYQWYWDVFNAQHASDKRFCNGLAKAVSKQQMKKSNCLIRYEGGLNEFANQLGLSLPSRLRRQMFPATQLTTQHRLTEAMVKMPNSRIYKNAIKARDTGVVKNDISSFKDYLRTWLSPELPKDFSTIYIEATSGKQDACVKERGTTESKRNHYNADAVYDLLSENFKRKLIAPKDITIITPYRDQARLYEQVFRTRGGCGMLEGDHAPRVLTPDLTRGHQNRVVIYDLVVALGDASHGIGIVSDEMRTNLAITRASELLIIVGSTELVDVFPSFWEVLCGEQDFKGEPLPYIIKYATMLKQCGLSFPPSGITERTPCTFEVEYEWLKDYTGYFEWEHSKNIIANQAGREHDDTSWQDANGLGGVHIVRDEDTR